MKIVVDENIPLVEAFFADSAQIDYKAGRLITAADVADADALLVRSVTKVDQKLLAGSRVTFVGSATIGEDHLDTQYLQAAGIAYATAPASNAQSVVEYVAAALLELEARGIGALQEKTLGIVGVGAVGGRLKALAQAWGMQVLATDPPLADQGQPDLVSLQEVLQADIISLHTPLTQQGSYPTYHLFDQQNLAQLKNGAVLINTSRGSVVDNQALKALLEARTDLEVVLDVWEGEPLIDVELAQRVAIATPHIAGYSYDGKIQGTAMIYAAFCQHFGLPVRHQLTDLIPEKLISSIDLDKSAGVSNCLDLVQKVYRIGEDDLMLRNALKHPEDRRIAVFDQLRKHYRVRREFSTVKMRGLDTRINMMPLMDRERIAALGFV